MLVASPILVEPILPSIPIKHLRDGIHQRRIFTLGGRKINNCFTTKLRSDDSSLESADERFFAFRGRVERLSDVELKPAPILLVPRGDRLDNLSAQCNLI